MRLAPPVTLSGVVHAIHLFGLQEPMPHPTDRTRWEPAIKVVLDHELGKEYFGGNPPLVTTRDGVRCPVVVYRDAPRLPERETHPGQLLAVLASQGVSLDTPLTTAEGQYEVRDILNDTMANLSLDQKELEWAVIALARYLPPKRSWKDKFGREIGFNDLAHALLKAPLERPGIACQGIHILEALATLWLADRQAPVLGAGTRLLVVGRLQQQVAILIAAQEASGEWPVRWYESPPVREVALMGVDQKQLARQAVTATGHNLEWLSLLPPEMGPSDEVFIRAGQWLKSRVLAASDEDLSDGYCPYSHAACMVKWLATHEDRSEASVAGPTAVSASLLAGAGEPKTEHLSGGPRLRSDPATAVIECLFEGARHVLEFRSAFQGFAFMNKGGVL